MHRQSQVVVGLPVYNGEEFIAEAITSILAQTHGDFRLIIADNCSTDGTEDICRSFAAQDDRIEFNRHAKNIGSGPNFNSVFKPGDAPYFRWAAHDDVMTPCALAETVALLDAHPEAVIAHGRSQETDAAGVVIRSFDHHPTLAGAKPQDRFWSILWARYFTEIFGLMRVSTMRETDLFDIFPGTDRNFIAQMVLRGDVVYSREVVFRRREHENAYVASAKSAKVRQKILNPAVKRKMPLPLEKTKHYLATISEAPISAAEKSACRRCLASWAMTRAHQVVRNRLFGHKVPMEELFSKRGLVRLQDHIGLPTES